jgi:predicted CoA-binding protein
MSTNDSNSAIYERLVVLEIKVDKVAKDTVDVVAAFRAAQGAFTVLEWIAKAAKPIIWVCGIIAALSLLAQDFRK